MLGGFAQAALRAVINITIALCTGLLVHSKLGNCSRPPSPHFPDKPKVQIGRVKVSLIARA